MLKDRTLKSARDMIDLVKEIGFLPLFDVGVPEFSVEALTRGQWWTGKADDPWGWRVEAAASGEIIYAKIFQGRAGFVSPEWFKKFANYRRDGYDYDSRWEEGLETIRNHDIMECVSRHPMGIMTSEIKKIVGKTGFDGALTHLQNQTYLIISGFERKRNRFGEPYGWEIAVIDTPENVFGADTATGAYNESPEKSIKDIIDHLRKTLKGIDEDALYSIFR